MNKPKFEWKIHTMINLITVDNEQKEHLKKYIDSFEVEKDVLDFAVCLLADLTYRHFLNIDDIVHNIKMGVKHIEESEDE